MALQDELDRTLDVLATTRDTLDRALSDLVGPTVRESQAERSMTGLVMPTLSEVTELANQVCSLAAHIASVINTRGDIEAKEAMVVSRESAKRLY